MQQQQQPYVCRVCHSAGPFYEAYLAHSNYLCKSCASKAIIKHRKQDAARLLAHRLYNALRRSNVDCNLEERSVDAVKSVMERCSHRSVISGEEDTNQLCVIPYFRDIPLQPWHCIIVTTKEARSIAHLKSPEKIEARFPTSIQRQMRQQRAQRQ